MVAEELSDERQLYGDTKEPQNVRCFGIMTGHQTSRQLMIICRGLLKVQLPRKTMPMVSTWTLKLWQTLDQAQMQPTLPGRMVERPRGKILLIHQSSGRTRRHTRILPRTQFLTPYLISPMMNPIYQNDTRNGQRQGVHCTAISSIYTYDVDGLRSRSPRNSLLPEDLSFNVIFFAKRDNRR